MNQLHIRVRALRLRQRRTLREIARRCRCSISLLSKIESGKTIPPVATLTKIAAALGVSLGSLLGETGEVTTAVTTRRRLLAIAPTSTDQGYDFRLLAGGREVKVMQPVLFTARRGKIAGGLLTHSGEEFIYVLKGRMTYRVGETTYTLGPGDSIYFNAEEGHTLAPLTLSVEYLAVLAGRPGEKPL